MKEQNERTTGTDSNRFMSEVLHNDQLENVSAGVSRTKYTRPVKAPGMCYLCRKEGVYCVTMYKFKGVYTCMEKGHIYSELSEDSYIRTDYRMVEEIKKYL